MSVQRDPEPALDTHNPSTPSRTAHPPRRSIFRRPSASPPPYSGPPASDIPAVPPLPPHLVPRRAATPTSTQPQNRPETPSRRLPPPPEPRIGAPVGQPTPNHAQLEPPSRATDSLSPSPITPRFMSPRTPAPLPPQQPHIIPPTQVRPPPPSTQITKRSKFHPFSALKMSKATRHATAEIAKQGAWKAAEEAKYEAELAKLRIAEEEALAREKEEQEFRRAETLAEARETVKSCVETLLLCGHPSEADRKSLFLTCSQVCKKVGLDLATLLQEPFIEEQTPVYWAILNRPTTSPEIDVATSDALIIALLNECGPPNETTIASVRLACMLISNNALLQFLFWKFPGLSPLSTRDRMLLGPSGGGDVVDVEETLDGTGAFIAHMKIRRFRLRMNVSTIVKVEFVTFERTWMASFSAGTERTPGGPSESKRVFSLELADSSMPAWVQADLRVTGHYEQGNTSDNNEPIFSVPIACDGRPLQPGPGNAIKVRLDDGPMGHHWVNESLVFVDADGTLHAQLSVKFTQPVSPPPTLSVSPDQSDTWSQLSSVLGTPASNSHVDPPRPPASKSKKGIRKPVDPNKPKPVFTSNRKGGHGR